jgi:hypothetical protein
MNQIAFEWEVRVQMKEGPDNIRVLEMNKEMNRTLRSNQTGKEYFYPIERAVELIASIFGR